MNQKKKTQLLDTLNLPTDLQDLSVDQLDLLAQEIRGRLLEIGEHCGGHLASNLGVVELSIVIHTLFSSPTDKFIWDTSHQSYVHKMLTGRLNQMFSIRQENGLSGFTNIFESPHDAFGAGHASTSLSAALGFAHSRDLLNQDHHVVSIFGDASLSGGMAFEALNNVHRLNSNFICILNDNDMSISKPVGNMSTYMTKIRTSPLYDQARKVFDQVIGTLPKSEPLKRRIEKSIDRLRDIIIDQKVGVIFEEFGFQYLGPIDGHNIPMLMAALKYAKSYPGPILIHTITQKGKGHEPAEADPIKYHGISPQPASSSSPSIKKSISNSEFFGKTMIDICNKRKDVVVVTPAMIGGSGLTQFSTIHPDRLFDVGIAEEHAVTFVAGLARSGITPVLAIYSTFLQRGYDQLIHDVCLQKLPVIFALDRAGFAGEDGATHHGVFDFAYMLPLPNLTILAPKNASEIEAMLHWALTQNKAISIRYPKGTAQYDGPLPQFTSEYIPSEILFQSIGTRHYDLCIIGIGSMASEAKEAAKQLDQSNVSVTAVNLRSLKPLDTSLLEPLLLRSKFILIVEEGSKIGGAFSFIQSSFNYLDKKTSDWHHLGIPDQFYDHGKIPSLRRHCGLDATGITEYIRQHILSLNNQPS